jgi:hypothetical protein
LTVTTCTPFPGQGVQIDGQNRHQGFAFAGFHFGDFPLVKDHAAHNLHIVGAQADGPFGRLAGHGKSFRQEIV